MFAFTHRIQEKLSEVGIRTAFTDKSYAELEKEKRADLAGGDDDIPLLDLEHNEELAIAGKEVLTPFVKSYLRFFLPRLPEEGIK